MEKGKIFGRRAGKEGEGKEKGGKKGKGRGQEPMAFRAR